MDKEISHKTEELAFKNSYSYQCGKKILLLESTAILFLTTPLPWKIWLWFENSYSLTAHLLGP